MKRSDIGIGKRYWIPSGSGKYCKPMRRKLLAESPINERLRFRGHISRTPEQVFETKKECQDFINQEDK